MSLINDMLKDLEQRPLQLQRHSLLQDLRTDISRQLTHNRNYYYIIGVLSIILLFFSFLYFFHQHRLATISAPAKKGEVAKAKVIPPAPLAAIKPVPTDLTRLSSIAFQVQQDTAFLRFLLSQIPLYQVSSESSNHEITITFQNTHLAAAIPKMDYAGSGIENITAVDDNTNNLKLIVKLNPAADVKRLELNQDGAAPELQMEVTYHPVQVGDSNSYSVKKAITEAPADQQYQHALSLATSDRIQDAITLLQGLVIEFPHHDKAREYLAGLLLQENNSIVAERIVLEGLKLNPDYPPYVKLEAHMLMERDELNQAVTLLEKKPPTIAEYPDYHALLAALYQRTNKSVQAANLYKQLLSLEPQNAKWWVGLGVALESNNDPSQALEAFVTANNIGGLSPTLKTFLDTQLNTLSS
jgi:tetratricopeptide (TPR) repeat protein